MSKKTLNLFAKTSASVVLEAELKALGQSTGPVSFWLFKTERQQNKKRWWSNCWWSNGWWRIAGGELLVVELLEVELHAENCWWRIAGGRLWSNCWWRIAGGRIAGGRIAGISVHANSHNYFHERCGVFTGHVAPSGARFSSEGSQCPVRCWSKWTR